MRQVEQTNDYYELLQVSGGADLEMIHRSFRALAARLHPDNPMSGDSEKFLALQRAYQVLADPVRRAQYDDTRLSRKLEVRPEPQDRLVGVETEVKRRLGVLSILYQQRCTNEENPSLAARELEELTGVPRVSLNFTLWYLRAKGYITREDNSDCSITAQGVDFIEERASAQGAIAGLLTANSDSERTSAGDEPISVLKARFSYQAA